MTRAFLKLIATSAAMAIAGAAHAAGGGITIERQHWPFAGFWGQYDKAQLQRGFQVFQEKCSSCHGLKRLYFRNLVQSGGPEFPEDAVKELARSWPNKITDGPNDSGEMFERDAKLPDPILGPFKNAKAAAAAFGAPPPDLSVIAKARNVENHSGWVKHIFLDMPKDVLTGYQEGGPDYIYALLTGYHAEAPAYRRENGALIPVPESEVGSGKVERCASVVKGEKGAPDVCNALGDAMSYNAAFPGHQIAMPPPLSKDAPFTYQDGTGTHEQNVRDIAAFLSWAADPSLNQRKSIGWQVMLYLLITTALLYIGKLRIWSRVH